MIAEKTNLRAESFEKATKLWQILRIALIELEECEKDPKIRIDMSVWHMPYGENCAVCVAGAVIHNCFDGNGHHHSPTDYPPSISRKLQALEHLRRGHITNAYESITPPPIDLINSCVSQAAKMSREIPLYCNGKTIWWAAMRKLLADLKEADL